MKDIGHTEFVTCKLLYTIVYCTVTDFLHHIRLSYVVSELIAAVLRNQSLYFLVSASSTLLLVLCFSVPYAFMNLKKINLNFSFFIYILWNEITFVTLQ